MCCCCEHARSVNFLYRTRSYYADEGCAKHIQPNELMGRNSVSIFYKNEIFNTTLRGLIATVVQIPHVQWSHSWMLLQRTYYNMKYMYAQSRLYLYKQTNKYTNKYTSFVDMSASLHRCLGFISAIQLGIIVVSIIAQLPLLYENQALRPNV